MKQEYSIRKFDGDSIYSWAVFRKNDVKGTRGVVFYGQAKPVVCGLSKSQAEHYRSQFENGVCK